MFKTKPKDAQVQKPQIGSDVAQHLMILNDLNEEQIGVMAKARTFGKVETFDLLHDEGKHLSGWHVVWDMAEKAVNDSSDRCARASVRETAIEARDVAAAAAVGLFLGDEISTATRETLMRPWLSLRGLKGL